MDQKSGGRADGWSELLYRLGLRRQSLGLPDLDRAPSTTDTGNPLAELDGFSFTHDNEGRTLTKSKTVAGFSQFYHWNERSQLDSVTTIQQLGLFTDTFLVRYAYDGLGRRISRDGSGGFEEYLYDGPHVIAILDDQQNVTSTLSYYPGVDRPHSLMTSTETYYYATDPTGSVSGLAEFTGGASVTHRYRYDVWGNPQGGFTEAAPNPLRFKARLWDVYTGLVDFRARWYDPDIGRFISEDPIGLADGINVYRFVGNDPVSGWDPFGMDPDGPCDEDEESTGRVVGYDPDTGIPILETLEVCVEGGSPGPGGPVGPGVGPGGSFPQPLGGNRSGPSGGNSGQGPDKPTAQECLLAFTSIGDAFGLADLGPRGVAAAYHADAAAFATQWQDAENAPSTARKILGKWLAFVNFTYGVSGTTTSVVAATSLRAPAVQPGMAQFVGLIEYGVAAGQSWAVHGDPNFIGLTARACAF